MASFTTTTMDFRDENTKKSEDDFTCKLLSSDYLYEFISSILFKIIKKCKELNINNNVISSFISFSVGYKETGGMDKNGYNCTTTDCSQLINITQENLFLKFNKEKGISFSQLMGALYKFTMDNSLVQILIENDNTLKEQFVKNVIDYFLLPPNTSYDDIDNILKGSKNPWFYIWILSFTNNNRHNFFHGNLINTSEYIRKFNNNTISLNTEDLIPCKEKQINSVRGNINTVILGSTYVIPVEGTIWYNFMKKYNKEAFAGPSSSCVLTYQFLVNFMKIVEPNNKNKVLLLLCCLSHYYQISHSFSEVLQQYIVESELDKVLRYSIDQNDVEYVNKLITAVNDQDIQKIFKGGNKKNCKTKYKKKIVTNKTTTKRKQ